MIIQQVGKAPKTNSEANPGTQDLEVKITLKGLSAGCIGVSLFPIISMRISLDDCNGGQTCVLRDMPYIPIMDSSEGCKVNDKGACSFKMGLNKTYPGLFLKNRNLNFQILGCGVTESTNHSDSPPISCGTFLL